MRRLQQTVAPFVREPRAFAQVARGAGDHEVLWAVGPATGERSHVVNVVVPANLGAAPVALASLPGSLSGHVGGGVGTGRVASGSPFVGCLSDKLLTPLRVRVSLTKALIALSLLALVLAAVGDALRDNRLAVLLVMAAALLANLPGMFSAPGIATLVQRLPILGPVRSALRKPFVAVRLTVARCTIPYSLADVGIAAVSLAVMSPAAGLANGRQTETPASLAVKPLRGCRVRFSALRTRLLIHVPSIPATTDGSPMEACA